jgi:hypothetical protein
MTFGTDDFIRVPSPAARTTTAARRGLTRELPGVGGRAAADDTARSPDHFDRARLRRQGSNLD